MVMYSVRKVAKGLSKYHYHCPMLLMQTTEIAGVFFGFFFLQTKAIFHHVYRF